MNKLIILFLAGLLFATPVFAQSLDLTEDTPIGGIWEKVPELKNAVLVNVNTGDIEYGAFLTAANYKGFNFDVGYSPENVLLFGLSYNIATLQDFGVDMPILKHVKLEPSVSYGFGRIENFDFRNSKERIFVGLNLLDVRF